MKLKKLIGICCFLFCFLVYFSLDIETDITIKDYEWDENMEIVKEYHKMKEEELHISYEKSEKDTLIIENVEI